MVAVEVKRIRVRPIGMIYQTLKYYRFDARQQRLSCIRRDWAAVDAVDASNSKINGSRQVNLRTCAVVDLAKIGSDRFAMVDGVYRRSSMKELLHRMRRAVHVPHVVMTMQVSV